MNSPTSSRLPLQYLDTIIASAGICFVAPILVWLLDGTVVMAKILLFPLAAFLLVFLGYLVLGRGLRVQRLTSKESGSYRRFYAISSFIFLFLLVLSSALTFANDGSEVRPTSYFIVTSILLTLLAVEILHLPGTGHNNYAYLTLAKLVILLTSFYWTPSLLHMDLLRDDPYTHRILAAGIAETGHIPEGHQYSKLPIMHLLFASEMIVSNVDYKWAAMLCLTLVQVIVVSLCLLLLSRQLFKDERIGLLGALLWFSNGRTIPHGIMGTPTAFATTFVLVVVYLIVRARFGAANTQITFIYMVVALWLVLVHSLTPAALVLLLIVAYLVSASLSSLGIVGKRFVTVSLWMLLAIGLINYWMYVSGHWARFVLVLRWGFTKFGVVGSFTSPWAAEQMGKLSVSDLVFSVLGLTLLCSLAIIGTLHMFRHFEQYASGIFIPIVGCVFGGFLVLETAGRLGTAGDRWMYYALPFLSLCAAVGLLAIPRRSDKLDVGIIIYALLLVVLAFFSITDPLANDDNPIYAHEITPQRYLQPSELQALNTTCRFWHGKVRGDGDTLTYVSRSDLCSSVERVHSLRDLHDGDFSLYENTLLLTREHFESRPLYGWGIFQLDYDLEQALETQKYSRVYDSGGMAGYRSPK